jgi:hypothetical protein
MELLETGEMNRLLLFQILVGLLGMLPCFPQHPASDLDDVLRQASAVLAALEKHAELRRWDDPAIIIEGRNGLRKVPEFEQLRQMMLTNWSQIATLAMRSDVSPMRRTFVIVAAHALPPEQYRHFLDSMVGYAEKGDVTKQELKWVIAPPYTPLFRVWINTWDDPQTRSVVERVKRLFVDEPSMRSYCDRLLTGELKEESIRVEKAMTNPPQTLDGLPPTVTPQSSPQSAAPVKAPPQAQATSSIHTGKSSLRGWIVWLLVIVGIAGVVWMVLRKAK